jgi:hypothetical protein
LMPRYCSMTGVWRVGGWAGVDIDASVANRPRAAQPR